MASFGRYFQLELLLRLALLHLSFSSSLEILVDFFSHFHDLVHVLCLFRICGCLGSVFVQVVHILYDCVCIFSTLLIMISYFHIYD